MRRRALSEAAVYSQERVTLLSGSYLSFPRGLWIERWGWTSIVHASLATGALRNYAYRPRNPHQDLNSFSRVLPFRRFRPS